MGPNKNNFFKDPTENRKSYHPGFEDATKVSKKHQERVELIQKLLVVDTEAAAPKTLILSKPAVVTKETSSTSSSSTAEQAILTSKYHKKTKFHFVDQTFQKRLAVQSKCESSLQKVAKGFCLPVVHSGVNKCLSESTIIEMYNTAYRGIYDHHLVQEESYKEFYSLPKEKTIMATQQCFLDKNNIIKYEKVILKAYKKNPDSKYSIIKKAPYWGIMHDSIQKFLIVYNGMLLQTINPETYDLVLVPFGLMKMQGGVNAYDIESLMNAFGELLDIMNSPYQIIQTIDWFENVIKGEIPVYFKLGVIKEINKNRKEILIAMSDRLPITNCGDGVSATVKAARVGAELYGLLYPDFRCSAHSVDGCWKRIARSETMSVNEVKTLYESLKLVVKHFKFSSKSKELLDNCMAALEMSHGIHLMTWCTTRMVHFLEACKRFDELLIPVYNAMVIMDLKQEERDKLFQANNIFTMKLIADQPIMLNRLQCAVDRDGHLVSENYRLAQQTANNARKLETPTADKFVESLHLDNNRNLMFTESINNSDHLLRLSDSNKPTRGKSED